MEARSISARTSLLHLSSAPAMLEQSIRDRTARVGVIGLGYVGLPLVSGFAGGGFRVTGFDVDPEKVAALESNRSYIAHFPASRIVDLRARGLFEATADFARLSAMDAIV